MSADLLLLIWIQDVFGPEVRVFWDFVTDLGSAPFVLLVVGMAHWHYGTTFGVRLMVAAVVGIVAVDLLKIAFFEPRPYYISSEVQAWRDNGGLGMPSGHAAVAVCVWGTVATSLRRRPVTVAASMLVLLIGISRVYLGVHSPSQVVVGWALGLGLLFLVCRCEKLATITFNSLGLGKQLSIALLSTVLVLGLKWCLIENAQVDFEIPVEWELRYRQAQASVAMRSGALPLPTNALWLFRSVDVDHVGAFTGIWLVLIYVAQRGGLAASSRREELGSLVLGGCFVTSIVAALDLIQKSVIVLGIVAAVVPIVLAIGVPTASASICRLGEGQRLGSRH